MRKVKKLVLLLLLCSSEWVFAQNTFSPYTINGIGDLFNMSLSNQFGMGEVGIGTPSVWNINNLNPALLPYNRLTSFQMGIGAESRTLNSQTETQSSGTGGLQYMVFAFPLKELKWSTSFGFMPLSSVNYDVTASDMVPDTTVPVTFNFQGEGGITQAYLSNGFTLGKGLTGGFTTTFLFGSIKNQTITDLGDNVTFAPLSSALFQKTDYRGFKLAGGLAYRKKVSDKRFLNFGMTFQKSSNLNTTKLVRLERRGLTGSSIPGDTLVNNQKGTFNLPSEIGLGFSYELLNAYTISFDLKRQSWSRFAESGESSDEFRSTLNVGLGVEFIPDYTSVTSYFKRVRYRFGMSYQQLPYVINGNSINDFGINFGWSIPFYSSNKPPSSIDMAFKIGQRGTKSNDLIRERYFKFIFGATINDIWFIQSKYN